MSWVDGSTAPSTGATVAGEHCMVRSGGYESTVPGSETTVVVQCTAKNAGDGSKAPAW